MAEPIQTDDRGFYEYGTVTDSRRTTVRVKESSAADGPHVWLFVKQDPLVYLRPDPGEASAHLNAEQCRALIALLQRHLDEIPSRWASSSEAERESR